ncbi:MAG: hypothetical protein AAFQ63_05165 [Cyanobacteria bacterium J06621_11]
MPIQRLSALLCSLAIGLLSPVSMAQTEPSSATEAPSPHPIQSMITSLGQQCNRATEVTYRSDQLVAPDGAASVHVEGILRKTVYPDSQLRQVDTDSFCYPDSRETVSRQIVIQDEAGTRLLNDSPYNQGYVLYRPRSFSADSRFLAMDVQVAYTGGDPGNYVLFLDLENDSAVEAPDVCENLIFQNYVGFASETEVVVLCQDYGGPTSAPDNADLERYELVNLLDGSVRTLASRPDDLSGYGRLIRSFEVTKMQRFE